MGSKFGHIIVLLFPLFSLYFFGNAYVKDYFINLFLLLERPPLKVEEPKEHICWSLFSKLFMITKGQE
jgi:hypothetical protein